jgi:two-component system OmpR family sensor kinase
MTLRGRLARFYAVALALVLSAFALTVYAIVEAEEAAEPPEVKALEPPEHLDERLLVAFAVALPAAIAVAIGGARVIARRGLQPLDDVVATAERISADNLAERIAPRPDAVDELARLVASVNGMLARLEQSVDGMRRFTADASHELRTPLAALMGELEVTLRRPRGEGELRGAVESTLEELGRMARLVDALLTLARVDARGLPVAAVDLALSDVVRRAAEPYEAVLAARNVALTWEASADVRAHADPLWVGRIVANLLDNACKFTPDAGEIRIAVVGAGGRPRVEVRDSGPGVPAADAERIFERFYRGAAARAGTDGFGLGLPLAREIARALGGELLLATAAPPAFVLELPAARV